MQKEPEWNVKHEEHPGDFTSYFEELDWRLIQQVDHDCREGESGEEVPELDRLVDFLVQDGSQEHVHCDSCGNEEKEWEQHRDQSRVREEILCEHGEWKHAKPIAPESNEQNGNVATTVASWVNQPDEDAHKADSE